ncbi:MAG TPA: calcium-binding protein [Tepidisphaeraceae bacterium]|jgi:Ca2+-binding RTX toxin-like protein|nr:calcium-binding protein [Tepidisphaeraceae bacterium]
MAVAEVLERRTLLAAFASIDSNGILTLRGTAGDDSILVSHSGSSIIVKLNSTTRRFNASAVKAIFANGQDGDDTIEMRAALPSTLVGGSGDDTLIGGPSADDLRGGSGGNTIYPNTSNDIVDFSDQPPVTLISAQADSPALVLYNPSKASQGVSIISSVPFRILGTSGNDSIRIDSEELAYPNVTIDGGGGNDSIFIDRYSTDESEDQPIVAAGGAGDDTIRIDSDAPASTSVQGGSGNDLIQIGKMELAADPNAINGGAGQDTMDLSALDIDSVAQKIYRMGPGVETFIGSSGNGESSGDPPDSDYTVIGNDLNNQIFVPNQVTVQGMGGDDLIACEDRDGCVLSGGNGNDTLISGRASTFIGPQTGNTLIGDEGKDTADYSRQLVLKYDFNNNEFVSWAFSTVVQPLRITLDNKANDGMIGQNDNAKSDIETVIGGSGNDFIQGNPSNNNLIGGAGLDTLWGGPGNDILHGGKGKDKLYGQAGADTLYGQTGNDSLDGGAGADRILPGDGNNTGVLDVATDVLDYTDATPGDFALFADGNAPVKNVLVNHAANADGPFSADDFALTDASAKPLQFFATAGSDNINGTLPFDAAIHGGAGDDFLQVSNDGETGKVSLFGDAGNDFLQAKGEDFFTAFGDGGPGDDHYEFFDSHGFVGSFIDSGGGQDTLGLDISGDVTGQLEVTVPSGIESCSVGTGSDDLAIVLIGNSLDNDLSVEDRNPVTILGGDGNDTLSGTSLTDSLNGGNGNDLLTAKNGIKDALDGGAGFDTASRDNGPDVFDSVKNIEKFIS